MLLLRRHRGRRGELLAHHDGGQQPHHARGDDRGGPVVHRVGAGRNRRARAQRRGPDDGRGPDRCHTSELTGSLAQGDAAAGNRYATLTLTNTGGEVCTVYGYGGIGLVAQDGSAAPTQQVRVDPAPRTVTLQPGQAVASTLHWTVVATGSEPTTGDCEPTPAA
ncbi:DUF4232 domain-containing protein [Klenkia terrae]|uniref:DUF4232 domain-containing protein n=1 Tax=Klenkia terrae TaxID=1052259 RepID=UPI0036156C2F